MRGLDDVIKYDGSHRDRTDAIESFYQESAWVLAEDLYDARRMARELISLLAADRYTEEHIGAYLGVDELPEWATR